MSYPVGFRANLAGVYFGKARPGKDERLQVRKPAVRSPHPVEFVSLESPAFAKLADQHLGQEGMEALTTSITENPETGKVVKDTDGARKIRVALEGRGKSGGARVIYFYRHANGAVFFLALYPKNQKENLTADDKKEIRAQIKKIREDAYP